MRINSIALSLVFVLSLAFFAGCAPENKTYPVQGKVVSTTGIAPTFGTIEFRAVADGRTASGTIERDGTFALTTFTPNDGAVAGEHEVILVRMITIEDGKPLHTHGHAVEIPTRYAQYETSDLKAEVKAAKQNEVTITFDPAD